MTAILSPDRVYRYALTRQLDQPIGPWRPALFVMLNPSTADETLDDQTTRRCRRFATREFCTSLALVNLYAYRTVSPAILGAALAGGTDIVGPETDEHVRYQAARTRSAGGIIVAAWGARPSSIPAAYHDARIDDVLAILDPGYRGDVKCLGRTASGDPRHPSRLPNDTPLGCWP